MSLARLEYLFPHRITDIGEEEWEKMRKYLIGTLGVGSRYGQEPDPEHRFEPDHHLDIRRTVLVSRRIQSKVVVQFWLPQDEEYLQGVHDNSLHHSIHKYFIQSALVENELYDRMEWVWTIYLKLLEEITSLRAYRGADSGRTAKTPVPTKIYMLTRELQESERKARRIEEALQERDRDVALAEMEKDGAVYARRRLDKEHEELVKLQGEFAHL
ncbi:uncharacterized protein A4U43_C03F5520 [Asparagus officinalis]|uniref:Uncharacterized protein n=1 Tax=Asparagus officinalis TaxID=4686 RepID=A0A5P1FC01_ASPOF|nr:uncharacterized protein A4U43_C03F5520 [Asparagus officinalis]